MPCHLTKVYMFSTGYVDDMPRVRNTRKRGRRGVYRSKEYNSSDGMLTTVWGPSMWHYLHTMSFNYPVRPTPAEKRHYRDFVLSMQHTLPCRHCRENLVRNFRAHPLKPCHLANRDSFSRYIYGLHETVNKMLGKKSGLTFCAVRERYEHFRARCTQKPPKMFRFRKSGTRKKEKGCTEPLYGKKAKCVIKIVPQETRCKTMQIDSKCVKTREATPVPSK